MRFEKLDLNLLVALDSLLETRSVTVAAQRICISQSGMTGALNRLRDFFEDDLLVSVGRRMMLTPRAEELARPVREALQLIKSTVTTRLDFNPATCERNFQIVASDYAYYVFIADVLREAGDEAPGVTFDICSPGDAPLDRLARGEIDVLLTLDSYLLDEFPKKVLFEDEHVVLCWADNEYCRSGITQEQFFELGHVVVYFGSNRQPAFSETHFTNLGVNRRIEMRVPTFSAIADALVETNRIATTYRRQAERLASYLPLRILPMPMPIPNVQEGMQWHSLRQSDKALHWLLRHIERKAAQLPPLART